MRIWDNRKNWEAIFKYLLSKKVDERSKKNQPYEPISINLSNINVIGKAMVKNIWKVGKNIIGISSESKSQDPSVNNQMNERNLNFALEEINWHMINLGLKNELTIDLIIELGMK